MQRTWSLKVQSRESHQSLVQLLPGEGFLIKFFALQSSANDVIAGDGEEADFIVELSIWYFVWWT